MNTLQNNIMLQSSSLHHYYWWDFQTEEEHEHNGQSWNHPFFKLRDFFAMVLNSIQNTETEKQNASKKLLKLTDDFSIASLSKAFGVNKPSTALLSKVLHAVVLFLVLWTLH